MAAEDQHQDWYFTFGHGQQVAVDANGMYVAIDGTFDEARDAMFAKFGTAWSWQYGSLDEMQPDRFGMRQVPFDDIAPVPSAEASDLIAEALDLIDRFDTFGDPGRTRAFIGDLRRIL